VPRRGLATAVDTALGWTGLAERSGERADRLSGGMKRRLNLAAGTLHEPRLLLLDEPTVGVDPGAREVIHDLLRRLRERGLGVLLTTHDLDQAAELADRIAFLTDGEIRAEGTLEELLHASFGDAKEISVRLEQLPGPEGRAALGDAGLSAADDEARLWSGPLQEGLDSLATFGARLAESGLRVEELRVREPGLRGVFFKLTGREFDE
jgi:ABC-2 type transport system ATP-binding protein